MTKNWLIALALCAAGMAQAQESNLSVSLGVRAWNTQWDTNVAVAVTGKKTPQAAMDTLAQEIDQVTVRCAPKLNIKEDPNKWLTDKGAPWKRLADERPKGETIAYDTLLNAWKAGKVR